MASSILHIKDSYYFEVPRFLYQSKRETIHEFPEVWIRNDPQYQQWEAHELAHKLEEHIENYNARQENRKQPTVEVPDGHQLIHHWEHWQHEDHMNAGRPFDVYLEREFGDFQEAFQAWTQTTTSADKSVISFFKDEEASESFHEVAFLTAYFNDPGAQFQKAWNEAKSEVSVETYLEDPTVAWTQEKIEAYNARLHGKILIPQPFGELRNLYERDSGFCISKFMIIEVVVALIIVFAFSWLGRRVSTGKPVKGRLANMLEVFLLFIRDQIARPAIGHGADKFVPLLWTLFMFVLGCNLFGMIPWLGAPTGTWATTSALALMTFGTVIICGMQKFGFFGFFLNQIPSMDLPLPIAVVIKPMILAIELLGLLIKHLVLSIRLLANMVAGHLVLLAVFGMAFGLEAALAFQDLPGWQHGITMVIVVLGTTAFSCLELFVAFLQAYVFTFLSALFISAAVHHH